MTRSRSGVSSLAAIAVAVACASPLRAADAVSGTATLNAQTISLAHGLGFVSGKRNVTLGLFAQAPSAAARASAARDGIDETFGVTSPQKGAYVLLKLSFPAGATRAEHVGMCEIDFYNFADSSLQAIWMGDEQCGVSGLGGDLEPGGVVHGRLKGSSKESSRSYTWHLAFTTTLQAEK